MVTILYIVWEYQIHATTQPSLHILWTIRWAQIIVAVSLISLTFASDLNQLWVRSSRMIPEISPPYLQIYETVVCNLPFGRNVSMSFNFFLFLGKHFYRWQGWTGLIACLLAEGTHAFDFRFAFWLIWLSYLIAILQMRLYALYSLNKKILALMLSCWVVCLGISAYVMYTVLGKLTGQFSQRESSRGLNSFWRHSKRHDNSKRGVLCAKQCFPSLLHILDSYAGIWGFTLFIGCHPRVPHVSVK